MDNIAHALMSRKQRKFGKVMREFHAGTLRSHPTNEVVTDVNVAKAIAASEAGMSRGRKHKR